MGIFAFLLTIIFYMFNLPHKYQTLGHLFKESREKEREPQGGGEDRAVMNEQEEEWGGMGPCERDKEEPR